MELDKNIEKIEKKIENNAKKIDANAQQIYQNTGALDILKAFKSDTNKFFIMWIITFMALLGSLGYIVYLLNDTSTIATTQEVTQENESGSNNYIGRDGDIGGKANN